MKLTQEEKRIKLAEAEGWEVIEFTICRVRPDKNGDPELVPIAPLPDYFNDFNAAHELEERLENCEIKWAAYRRNLWPLLEPHRHELNATAAQRAEAIGKTLNLW